MTASVTQPTPCQLYCYLYFNLGSDIVQVTIYNFNNDVFVYGSCTVTGGSQTITLIDGGFSLGGYGTVDWDGVSFVWDNFIYDISCL